MKYNNSFIFQIIDYNYTIIDVNFLSFVSNDLQCPLDQ